MDALEGLAERVMRELQNMGAIGAARAVTQAELARVCETNTRHLQEATLVLNQRGVPVLSSCVVPYGVFIAETDAEITAYDRQLRGRLIGNAVRRRCLRRILRDRIAARPVEPNGQGRLFA